MRIKFYYPNTSIVYVMRTGRTNVGELWMMDIHLLLHMHYRTDVAVVRPRIHSIMQSSLQKYVQFPGEHFFKL